MYQRGELCKGADCDHRATSLGWRLARLTQKPTNDHTQWYAHPISHPNVDLCKLTRVATTLRNT